MKTDNDFLKENLEKVKAFAKGRETPFLVVNLSEIEKNYNQIRELFPSTDVYYAVKANPEAEVLSMLKGLGSSFDAASVYEMDELLSLGVSPEKISYGNTIKKARDIKYAYEKGIRLFSTDSEMDLMNLIKYAPDAKVYIRLLAPESNTADWPLARKFGCSMDEAKRLILLAKENGMDIYGLSFHVGSQQRDVYMWDYSLLQVKDIFEWAKEEAGVMLEMINMGGGFTAPYLYPAEPMEVYAENILQWLKNHFHGQMPRIILEPGRSMVGAAGVIVSEVVLVAKKSHLDHYRWVFTDVGMFSGLIETVDECIKL